MKKTTCILLFAACFCLAACCQTPQQSQTINALHEKLQNGALSITQVLTDPQWMPLHSLPAFREIIKQNAKSETIKLTPPGEPGMNITVKGTAVSREGKPMSDLLVYFYHTSAKGWYADTAAHILARGSDAGHARLFGYVRTDREGKFAFETIRPEGYPQSDLPAHIHIAFWTADGKTVSGMPGELLFEEDSRLTPARKKEALQNGYLVAKNTGTERQGVYVYRIAQRN